MFIKDFYDRSWTQDKLCPKHLRETHPRATENHLSRRLMTKPTKWLCAQRRLRSAWASTQSDQSLLSTWRKLGSLATHWAHSEDWSDWTDVQADLSLRWAHISFCLFCHEAAHLVKPQRAKHKTYVTPNTFITVNEISELFQNIIRFPHTLQSHRRFLVPIYIVEEVSSSLHNLPPNLTVGDWILKMP